jgi:hypothetical protein
MLKAAVTTGAILLFSTATIAQTQGTPPPPPTGPSAAQCQEGYKEGSQWTKQQFEAACLRIKEGQKN